MTNQKILNDELKQILSQCLCHDEAAWEQMYRRIYPLVRHSVKRTGLSGESADDAVSEVYNRIIESIDQIAATQKPVAYIGAMSRYIALRMKQQEEKNLYMMAHSELDSDDGFHAARSASLGQEDTVQAKHIREALIDAYQKLSPENRRLIRLKYVDELCYEEIAYIDGRESGALRVATHRAIKSWRNLMPSDIGDAFRERYEIWQATSEFTLPADEELGISPDHRRLVEEYVSDCDMTESRRAFIESLLIMDPALRELKVKLERLLVEREDVRGHSSEEEIPAEFLKELMARIPHSTRVDPTG